jgi:predicted amidohydrolase YtcJ
VHAIGDATHRAAIDIVTTLHAAGGVQPLGHAAGT